MTINGTTINASVSDGVSFANATGSAQAIVNAINGSGVTGVTASVHTSATQTAAGTVVAADAVLAAGNLVINGVNITGVVNAGSAATDVQSLINAQRFATGVGATLSGGNKIVLTAIDGRNITETSNAAGTAITGFATSTVNSAGTVTLTSNSASSAAAAGITITNTGTNGGFVAGDSVAAAATGATVSAIDISTVLGANSAINSIDSALSAINTSRSQMGAYENRFHSVVANLQSTSTDLSAARSQIQDADFAAETANFTRSQILQQAGTAMLAQANSLPNSVLSLLK
jgi:flagellin